MKRRALLDVNVLIAIFAPHHIHHEAAHAWFGANRSSGWATCPLTENGMVRILSNPASSPVVERPAALAKRLQAFRESGEHRFWPDDVTLCDNRLFSLGVGWRQLTDVYLLGLAVQHQGRLATFDRSIPLKAVPGARAEHLCVIER